jgi:hypothetical protein
MTDNSEVMSRGPDDTGQKSHSGKLGIPIGWSVGMLTTFSTSPIEVIGYVSFPQGLVLSGSTRRAFVARGDSVQWHAGFGGGRS